VLRDLDLLRRWPRSRLVSVAISITTLNEDLRRTMEPRTSTAANRLRAIELLSAAGIPVFAMVAPLIPALNDKDAPAVLKAAAWTARCSKGCSRANWTSFIPLPEHFESCEIRDRNGFGIHSRDRRLWRSGPAPFHQLLYGFQFPLSMHQDTSVRHVFDRSVNAQFERFIPCALTEENALYNSADSDLCMDLFHW
jgi:hypothetical protein